MSDQFTSREQRRKATKGTNTKKQKNKKGKKKTGLFKKICLSLLVIGLLCVVAGITTFAVFASTAPSLDDSKLKTPYSSKIYDKNNKVIAEVGAEKRTYVSIKDIPDVVKEAFIATEDARFYQHHGIDPIRIGGALIANVEDGFGAEGGSTITQQVVKNTLLNDHKTLKRKVQEIWLSIQLEQKYSKDEILEMYLNRIFFTPQAYGVGKAAEQFFGVTNLNKLSIAQAATLAGMPQSPSAYNPVKHPEAAEKRRNIVLSLMKKQGYITNKEYEKAKATPVSKTVVSADKYNSQNSSKYSPFIEEVMEEVQKKAKVDVSTDGLKIHTTLDTNAQDHLDSIINGDTAGFTKGMQAGVTLLDTKNGEIRAIGGGRDVPVGGFNYAIDAKRQPGSTIKPILDYGPVIENKKWSTYQQIDDAPYTYSNGTPINNFDRRHLGKMSMRSALAQSRNIPALKAFQAAGTDHAVQFANNLGMDLPSDIPESYSIGGFDEGVSSLKMAGAFSAFGNNGYYNEPHAVTSVEFNDGTKLDLTPESKAAMSDYTAFMITDMLKTAVQSGTGTLAQVPNVEVAGKTGTTNFTQDDVNKYNIPSGGAKDSWFVGYTPQYTAAVWTGIGNSKEADGKIWLTPNEQRVAKIVFRQLISQIDDGSGSFEKPDSVVEATIEKGSDPAKLAGPNTPSDKKTTEYFVKGTAPSKVSDTYEKKEADKPSDLKAVYDEEKKSITLTWGYDDDADATFHVQQAVDNGGYKEIQNSSAKEAVISDVKPGSTYKFQVTATVDGVTSQAASTFLTIKDDEKEEEKVDDENKEEEPKQPDDEQTDETDDNKNQPPATDEQKPDDQKNQDNQGETGNTDNGNNDSDNGSDSSNGNNSSQNDSSNKDKKNSNSKANSQSSNTQANSTSRKEDE
ncbi:PBP1A family penicillin-binding protein [Bacillus sp. NPDC093026]|uniref:PBP1A family penicillin-binding protein n=1 Tax=Bacillus sp. NPDC093026 TaxID=3363948 RepID=UPI0037F92776